MEPIINETRSDFTRYSRRPTIWLAMAATATALCISALAGWQRGGSHAERLVWVGISLVLVVSAHLLPALVRSTTIAVRAVAWLLWIACMATACYGHATFFVLAQQHAGEVRAVAVPVVPVAVSARNLTAVMTERATVIAQLATARARYCTGHCGTLEARRVTLAARLNALDAEADEIRRRHAQDDRVTARRDALLADPVTSRLAALLGVTVARVDLLSGLVFAAVLEGVACLLWTIALRSSQGRIPASAVTQPVAPVVTPSRECANDSHDTASGRHASRDDPLTSLSETETTDDVTQLARDVTAGLVRPTVADIRRHLGCSQARAATLRRQLLAKHYPNALASEAR